MLTRSSDGETLNLLDTDVNTGRDLSGDSGAVGVMDDVSSRIVWKLARRHTWGCPIPARDLVAFVARSEDHDEVADILESAVLALPFVVRTRDGICIPNSRGSHVRAAEWLRKNADIDEFVIAATLSRLPDDWPDDR